MSIPFHKQTDASKQAGQHIYSFDREPYLKHSNVAPFEPRVEQALNEYIARKTEESKRITFDEWYFAFFNLDPKNATSITSLNMFLQCWNAALTKGKL